MDSEKIKEVINHFTYELRSVYDLKSTLHLGLTDFSLFSESLFNIDKTITYKNPDALENHQTTYDFILGDLPLGMNREQWKDDQIKPVKIRKNWIYLLRSLFLLNPDGHGLYVLAPALGTAEWTSFCDILNHYGFFVNAAFNLPVGALKPVTSIRPVMVLISRKKYDKLFIAEIDRLDSIAFIVKNFSLGTSGGSLDVGVFVKKEDFKSFDHYKLMCQIEKLQTQYKNYKHRSILDVSSEINIGKQGETFKEKENCIYLPRVGNSRVISDLQQAKLKHQNYIQVVLDSSVINNIYAELYFSSELGLLNLRSLYQGAVIPKLNKKDLPDCVIAIPDMQEQQRIVETHLKLQSLEQKIDSFRSELSINPTNADKIKLSVDNLLSQLNMLSESDRIRSLIRKGESKTLEFKETLSLCLKTKQREKYVELAALKTIDAFLNTDGGTLLVGVADDGNIPGIDIEIRKFDKSSQDHFLLRFKNMLKAKIGEDFYPLIEYSLVEVEECRILKVSCEPSDSECFLDGKDFYVRTNPATDKLEGPKLLDYVRRHFHK